MILSARSVTVLGSLLNRLYHYANENVSIKIMSLPQVIEGKTWALTTVKRTLRTFCKPQIITAGIGSFSFITPRNQSKV